jgi:radical SAM superfamily enzyme
LSFDNVIGLSIGTRTDCMTDEILDFLVEKSKNKEMSLLFERNDFQFFVTLKR